MNAASALAGAFFINVHSGEYLPTKEINVNTPALTTREDSAVSRGQRKLILGSGIAYICALIMLSCANFVGPDRWWWSGMNMYLPQWLWGIPGVILFPLFFWRARLFSWIPILGVICTAWPLMGYCWGSPGSAPGRKIRVMTWNIEWWRSSGLAGIDYGIAKYDPDVLMMQDARGAVDGPLKGTLKSFKVADFGQYVIASKFPVVEKTIGDISYRGEKHTYLRAKLEVDGRQITMVTAHFTTPRDGLSGVRHFGLGGIRAFKRNLEDRQVQAESIARDIRGSRNPVIIAGDLNAPISSLACRTLLDLGLRDTFALSSRGYGYTYGHSQRVGHSYVRIDHILASREFVPLRSYAGDLNVSDHRPVISDLALIPR